MKTHRLFNKCLEAIDMTVFASPSELPELTRRYEAAFAAFATAARTEVAAPVNTVFQTGVVASFNARTDCGFIRRDDNHPDLFFTGRDLFGDITRAPLPGDRVTFEEQRGPQIRQAVNVCNHACPASQAEFDAWNTPARQAARADTRATYARVDAACCAPYPSHAGEHS
jgi:cold shock CspA family protein